MLLILRAESYSCLLENHAQEGEFDTKKTRITAG